MISLRKIPSLLSFLLISSTIFSNATPANTVIVFDLHDVLFAPARTDIFQKIFKTRHKATLALMAMNPFVWHELRKILKKTHDFEQIFNELSKKFPTLTGARQDLFDMVNAQQPIQEVFSVVRQLKNKGYSLYIASNIGQTLFNDLATKFPKELGLFDGAFVSSAANGFVRKPNPAYFVQFKAFLAQHGQSHKQIVFIDDSIKNVTVASKQSITGIVYTTGKELTCSFKKLGIL